MVGLSQGFIKKSCQNLQEKYDCIKEMRDTLVVLVRRHRGDARIDFRYFLFWSNYGQFNVLGTERK